MRATRKICALGRKDSHPAQVKSIRGRSSEAEESNLAACVFKRSTCFRQIPASTATPLLFLQPLSECMILLFELLRIKTSGLFTEFFRSAFFLQKLSYSVVRSRRNQKVSSRLFGTLSNFTCSFGRTNSSISLRELDYQVWF